MTEFDLPWQPIETLTPEPGGDPVYVWNGQVMTFACWKYGWTFDDDVDMHERSWCEVSSDMVIDPQPTHYLPLSPPREKSK